MAKTKPHQKRSKKNDRTNGASKKAKMTPEQQLAEATALLHTSQPEEALVQARRALAQLHPDTDGPPTAAALPALSLLGEINVELGDADTAREYFTIAAALDEEGDVPESQGGGAEKFLWLAQLCEEGGAESVAWFEKGAEVLRREIGELEAQRDSPERQMALDEKKRKLANALCGVVEVYMTDLSWEEDAEARCEALITEALLVHPNCAESLQTLASVRISQLRHEEARAALKMSMDLWKDLKTEDAQVPDFSVRISLSRLLMEAEMEDEAMEVLERLVLEDDSSVEAWYLGGWCLHLLAGRKGGASDGATMLKSSRDWLTNSLRLYQMLEYEDSRLKDHAEELVGALDKVLGAAVEGSSDEWSSDEEMEGT